MNLFHSIVLAVSVAMMLSIGSSATATANYSHPSFSVTEGRTLSLRETGSQIVVDTIENALQQGGSELFGKRFQFDSSLNWVIDEGIEGELDTVIPVWDRNGHVVFTQPGVVFWTGIEEEQRIDGNLGAVYRTEMIDGVIGGVNLFYDHDFKIGHSRLGFGVDAQKDGFYGAFNYYLPLSDTQDGRDGYFEDALEGMDALLSVENNAMRIGGNVGIWKFQGEENVDDEWEFSYGIDGGIRIIPGLFLEGSLQHHNKDISLGRRASVGVAVRFSLPGLTGKNYGNSGKASNLYGFVERERRILYEERAENLRISMVRTGNETVEEGDTIAVDIRLNKALAEDIVINLVGSGSATYNDDWTMSVDGADCSTVSQADPCPVTISSGRTTAEVTVEIREDMIAEYFEEFTVSALVDPGVENIAAAEISSSLDFVISLQRASIRLSLEEDGDIPATAANAKRLIIRSDIPVSEDVTVNLDIGGSAPYNVSGGPGYHIAYRVVPAGGTSFSGSLDMATNPAATDCSSTENCAIVIPRGATIVDLQISTTNLEQNQIIRLSLDRSTNSRIAYIPQQRNYDFSIE